MEECEWMYEFANTLNDYMEERDISQRELAKRAGVSESTVSDLIRGQRMPSIKSVVNISNVLGISTDDLVNFNEKIR